MDRNNQDQPPESRQDQQSPPPLSQTIPNAHAAGDGSMGRNEETTVEPRKTKDGDEAIKKEPDNY